MKNGEFIGSCLQNGAAQLASGLAVAARVARGEDVEKNYTSNMPQITSGNVDDAIKHVVTERGQFLGGLSKLTDENLGTGDVAFGNLPGQKP